MKFCPDLNSYYVTKVQQKFRCNKIDIVKEIKADGDNRQVDKLTKRATLANCFNGRCVNTYLEDWIILLKDIVCASLK